MAKQPTNSAQNTIVLSVLVIVASLAAAYMFVIPQLTQARTSLKTAEAAAVGLDADKATLAQAKIKIDAALADLSARGVDLTKFSSTYPATEDMPGFYIQLEQLAADASASGLTVSYQVSNPVSDTIDGGVSIPVSFSATGGYTQLLAFIGQLEANTRPIIISSFSLSEAAPAAGSKVGPGTLSLSISAHTLAQALSSAYSAIPAS